MLLTLSNCHSLITKIYFGFGLTAFSLVTQVRTSCVIQGHELPRITHDGTEGCEFGTSRRSTRVRYAIKLQNWTHVTALEGWEQLRVSSSVLTQRGGPVFCFTQSLCVWHITRLRSWKAGPVVVLVRFCLQNEQKLTSLVLILNILVVAFFQLILKAGWTSNTIISMLPGNSDKTHIKVQIKVELTEQGLPMTGKDKHGK